MLAYAFTWVLLPLLLVNLALGVFGLLMPAVAAIVVTGLSEGKAGVKQLLRPLFIWRVHPVWYGVTLGLPILLSVVALVLSGLLGWPLQMETAAFTPLLITVFVLVVGEEIGWRGFALPRLLQRYSPVTASLVLGVLWAGWHLPMFIIPGTPMMAIPFAAYLSWVVMRLIITTRIDPPLPLARWRVRNQLAEVRADDLRFDNAEATTFFKQIMGLQLTAADIASLERRTEGWIAGLQLAALSLQGRDDVSGFIQSFSGSHRHVFSYLIEEVLNQRPAGTLDFLLQTAILERFNADLCNAVTGLRDSQLLLEKLEQANLFLISLDDERKWYRYHHLFAEVLRNHLQQTAAQTIPALHQRAAAWLAAQELWPEAIQHALTATDFATAAHLIEQVGIALFAQPDIQHSLQRWLSLLPAAFVDTRPRLCLLHAWICFAHLDFTTGLQWVEKAQTASVDDVIGETAAIRTLLAAYSPNITPAEAIAFGEAALATLPTKQCAFRGIAAGAMAMAHLRLGDVCAAEAAMAEANRMTRIVANFYLFVIVASNQAAMQRAQGYLRRAIATSQESIAWLVQQGALAYPTFSDLHLNLADLLREQNELDTLADKLIVTVGTVKKHLNNIYGKLGVSSRTQAIARGREVGLLAD